MDIKDLVPKRSEFKLEKLNRTLGLRPVTFRDRAWIKNKYGDELEKVMTEMNTDKIIAIAFHQLEDECKKIFAPIL